MLPYLTVTYFLILFLIYYKKNGFDISCCIVGVYLITSAASIYFMDHTHNPYFIGKRPTLIPSIVYCSMVTLVSRPFYRFNSNKIRDLKRMNVKIFNIMSWIFIGSFFFSLILFYKDLIFLFSLGDEVGQLRGLEFDTAQSRLSGPLKFISTCAVAMCSMSAVSFILFLYSVTFLKKPKWFNLLLFISSCGCIISGILNIDRSVMVFWIMNMIFIFFLFKPYLSAKVKSIISFFAGFLLWGAGAYLVNMTMSRFGDNALDSVIEYAGQNYINFCWFWDHYTPPVLNFGIFIPLLSHFFIDWGFPVGAVSFGRFVQGKVGYFVNVFYTFMGTLIIYLGQWAVVPFCIIYYIITRNVIKPRRRSIGIQHFIIIFILALTPYDGVIAYPLVDYIKVFGIIVLLFFCYIIKKGGTPIKLNIRKRPRRRLFH